MTKLDSIVGTHRWWWLYYWVFSNI